MIQADVLGERARLTPEKTALVLADTGVRLSYSELDQRASRCAIAWTESLDLEPGDRIGILAHNRLEYLDAFFAAGKSGVVLVTLGTRLTPHELSHVIDDSGMRALLYDGAFAATVDELRQRVEVETWIALDDPVESSDPVHAALLSNADPADWRGRRIDPEALYCLLYTSGTTGRPKGVMIPHRMVAWNGLNTVASWQLREDDVSPIFTPLYHAGGLMAFLVPLVTIGGTIVLHRGFDTSQIWRTIESERCTVVLGVPTIWKMLLEAPEFASVDLQHVRAFYSGGAPLPSFIIEAYQEKGVVFKQGFGMTEVGVNCFAMTVEDSFRKAGSIGRPMMFTEVRLVDEEGKDVPQGEVGEMLFRGPHVSQGYWHNAEATSAALDKNGWFHSGDLARCDEEGYYYVAGRRKDMIISGGVNVYPAEIEAELLQHEAVEDVAVVGVPDRKWGEMGVAFVVPLGGKEVTPETLIEHLESRLARFKIPKVFRIVESLPRTAYGKVVKGELRELFLKEGG
ncbi:MAG: long-chain fatty acid--CoA ligase [Acidobacteriota bacterium]